MTPLCDYQSEGSDLSIDILVLCKLAAKEDGYRLIKDLLLLRRDPGGIRFPTLIYL